MKTLTIKLQGPLQSYGDEAAFSQRTTSDYPRKSAIVGMLAAALGYHRDDDRVQALNDIGFAVRVDQSGETLTDLHTVEWKKNTRKLTYRNYLQDAIFLVAISAADDRIAQFETALHHPKFQLFLGRKANVPAGVLETQQHDESNPVQVLREADWQAAKWYQKKRRTDKQVRVDIFADAALIDGPQREWMVADNVQSFDSRDRKFGFRAIKREAIRLGNPEAQADANNTEHDVFSEL